MMIAQQIQPPVEDKRTFATNWYERVDEIFQLLMNEAVDAQLGENRTGVPTIERRQLSDKHGVFYLADKPLLGFYCDYDNAKWIIYAKKRH